MRANKPLISIILGLLLAGGITSAQYYGTLWYPDPDILKPVEPSWNVGIMSNSELRFYDNGNYVGFEAPALGADQIWVLPNADGGASEFLQTDGGGNLSWATPAGAGDITAVGPGCATGACWTDGLATVGTTLLIWEGTGVDANEFSIEVPVNPAADVVITMPTTTGTLIHTEVDPTVDTAGEILAIIDDTALDFGTGVLTATGFAGPLTGNVTGDCSGQAGTVATITGLAPDTATTQATQGNITSIANLATVGTIGTGVWEGTDIGVAHGGTAKSGWTQYAIPYLSATTTFGEIAIGNAGEVLTVSDPATGYEWTAVGAGDVLSVGNCTGGACFDGSSDGGTNIEFYNIDSNKTQLIASDTASDLIITLPATTGTLALTSVATLSSLTSIGTIGTGVWEATDVGVAYGGTGVSTLTDHGVLVGSGAGAITALTVGSNGQILIGSTGADPVFATLNADRSLTATTGAGTLEIDADPETYVFKAKIAFEDPTATDDFFFGEIATAVTFTSIYCKTLVGTAELDVQIAGADINGTDISCTTAGVLDDSLGGDTAGAVGEELKLAITSVASSPTYLMVQVNGTYND